MVILHHLIFQNFHFIINRILFVKENYFQITTISMLISVKFFLQYFELVDSNSL